MIKALFFTSIGCTPCVKMYPVIEQLQKENYIIEKVSANSKLAEKYQITSTPIIIVLNDDKVIKRFEGVTGIDKIREVMKPPLPDYRIW